MMSTRVWPKPRAIIRRELIRRLLPNRALCLICEFSKPITRAGWRNSIPIISTFRLYTIIKEQDRYSRKNMYAIILKNIKNTLWYEQRRQNKQKIKEYLAKQRIKKDVRLAKQRMQEDNNIKYKIKCITSHTFYNLSNTDHKILSNIINVDYFKTHKNDYNIILDEIIEKINSGQYSSQARYNISLY